MVVEVAQVRHSAGLNQRVFFANQQADHIAQGPHGPAGVGEFAFQAVEFSQRLLPHTGAVARWAINLSQNNLIFQRI